MKSAFEEAQGHVKNGTVRTGVLPKVIGPAE